MKLQHSNLPEAADPAQCPLCSQPNRCAMELEKATGQQQPPCWCTGVTFEPSLLAQIPPASRGQACVCMDCAASPRNAIAI